MAQSLTLDFFSSAGAAAAGYAQQHSFSVITLFNLHHQLEVDDFVGAKFLLAISRCQLAYSFGSGRRSISTVAYTVCLGVRWSVCVSCDRVNYCLHLVRLCS